MDPLQRDLWWGLIILLNPGQSIGVCARIKHSVTPRRGVWGTVTMDGSTNFSNLHRHRHRCVAGGRHPPVRISSPIDFQRGARTRMVGTQFNLPPASVERFHSVCFRNFLQFIPPNGWLMLWTNQSKIVCCTAAKKWILERYVVGRTTRCCGLCGVMTSDEAMLPVHSSCSKNDQIMVRHATSIIVLNMTGKVFGVIT